SKNFVKLAVISFILSNLFWGGASPIYKWSFSDIHPFTLAFLRFFIPSVLIGIFGFKNLKIQLKHVPLLLAVSLCDITFNVGLFFIALQYTQSINGPIIGSAGPVFLILASMLMLKERPTRKMLFGNLIGLTGVLLIVVQPVLTQSSGENYSSVIGNLLLIAATIAFALGTVFAKELRPYYSGISITFWSFALGSLTFLPLFLNEVYKYGFLPNLSDKGVYGLLYATVVSSTIAYFLYYWAIKYIHASETGIFSYTDPVVAVLIAGPLLNEHPTLIFFLGALMVFAGIYVAEGRLNYHPLHKLIR
ncbi:MAG: EamA family transporter, partial [Patescibacteria group bacterium]|nr:EamA family transporter [Patescibacteria group bacterium]